MASPLGRFSTLNPVLNPATGSPLPAASKACAGKIGLNSATQSAYGSAKVTVTVLLSSPEPSTLSITS